MAVKSKKQAGREQLQAGADRERSPAAPGRGRRARESRAPPQGSQTPGRAGSFTALLRTRLGLGPAASARLITVLIIGENYTVFLYHLFHLFENDRHFSHMSGMGDPAYFYVMFVFLLNGVMMSLFYIYGTYLSGSHAGGVITVSSFFFNHGESTRVMWTPPLRESFSYPFLVSLGVCFVLMFGNSMLLTSFYASSLISIWGVIYLRERFITSFGSGLLTWVMQCVAWVITTVILKLLLALVLGASDDAHISSLIKSKFTSYKDFDTMMYTCAAEFDFMEAETVWRYMKTLLLPVNVLVVAVVAVRVRVQGGYIVFYINVVYHSLQLVAFAVLAVLIMRLKLFLTPHMCLMAALLSSRQMFGWVGEKMKQYIIVFGILSIMTVQGVANLQNQWGIIGEFSNLPQEDLLEWIKENTPQSAVFAGAMPTMASVKLSAGRAIVNHPHYEDAGLRSRTKLVYAMYSRKPVEEVKRNLVKLQVDFFILEDSWCTRRSRPGCSMPEIWDVEDPGNAGKIPLCTLMSRETRPHFTTVFHNSVYKVLKVPRATGRTR
uniref:Dpy-19-like 1, like (H. sapiens) n=1 Tax=Astyanax mexicanus TaxID=7994 RepID=A0A8B9HBG3_ASTMX